MDLIVDEPDEPRCPGLLVGVLVMLVTALSIAANAERRHDRVVKVDTTSIKQEVMRPAKRYPVRRDVIGRVLIDVRDIDRPLATSDDGKPAGGNVCHVARSPSRRSRIRAVGACGPRVFAAGVGLRQALSVFKRAWPIFLSSQAGRYSFPSLVSEHNSLETSANCSAVFRSERLSARPVASQESIGVALGVAALGVLHDIRVLTAAAAA